MRKKATGKKKPRSDVSSKAKKIVKVKRKAARRKSAAPKTRNAESMSENAFWAMIKNCLRRQSRWWKPIKNTRDKVKRPYKGPNKRQRFEYQCNICKDYFPATQIQVDHIIPVGPLRCAEDLVGVVERLFCEEQNLQCICTTCHSQKSLLDIEGMRKK